jgi:hypothetical protein
VKIFMAGTNSSENPRWVAVKSTVDSATTFINTKAYSEAEMQQEVRDARRITGEGTVYNGEDQDEQ